MPAEAGGVGNQRRVEQRTCVFINVPLADQRAIYRDFDASGDNRFELVPSELTGPAGWIATKRQSDPARISSISFDLTADADVYLMFTRQPSVPPWITDAGFTDTGVTGRWRDNALRLVDYPLFKRSFASGTHVHWELRQSTS